MYEVLLGQGARDLAKGGALRPRKSGVGENVSGPRHRLKLIPRRPNVVWSSKGGRRCVFPSCWNASAPSIAAGDGQADGRPDGLAPDRLGSKVSRGSCMAATQEAQGLRGPFTLGGAGRRIIVRYFLPRDRPRISRPRPSGSRDEAGSRSRASPTSRTDAEAARTRAWSHFQRRIAELAGARRAGWVAGRVALTNCGNKGACRRRVWGGVRAVSVNEGLADAEDGNCDLGDSAGLQIGGVVTTRGSWGRSRGDDTGGSQSAVPRRAHVRGKFC